VGRSLGVGAGEQEAAVGVVGPRRPDLLAVEDPAVSVLDRTGREAGQVAAGVGLAEALRPDLLAGEELLDVGVLLPLAAEDVDRRRREADTETAEDGRSADRGQLLLVDRPPCSTGQASFSQPPRWRRFCQSRWISSSSSSR